MERTLPSNPNLTRSERRVAELVVTGLSNDEVADELDRSTNTIKTHLRHVYQKLGVRNRTELVQALVAYDLEQAVPDLRALASDPVYSASAPVGWTMTEQPLVENTPV